ncbi:uncharacterized protein [Henckelia pumila]|uniref:uncharacterized protein n=1 Tax=Henckelia pumila TaxID=405737 RepID=UPI003C6E7866
MIASCSSRATEEESNRVKFCLQQYEMASGQKVNFSKSSISFGANVSNENKFLISESFGVCYTTNHGNYLALVSHLLLVVTKRKSLLLLKEKACKRLHGWRHKLLSRAGKEILLKAVIQALPTYVMSVFLLTLMLCEELKQLETYNRTQLPSISSLKSSLYPRSSFLEANIGANPSYMWRSIMATQELIKKGVRVRIGNGAHTPIWGAPWLPDKEQPLITTECPFELQETKVYSLRLSGDGNWDLDLTNDIFNERDTMLILSIPLSSRNCEDKWMWSAHRKGQY